MAASGERRNIYAPQGWSDHCTRRASLARSRLSRARSRNAKAHPPQSNNLRLSTASTGVPNKKVTRTRPVPRCRGSPGHSGRIPGSLAETAVRPKVRAKTHEWPEAVDLIFITEFGRPVNVNNLVYKHFKPILKRAGLPDIRLYDLRHTAATLALSVRVSPKVVSEQLGHTSAAFTLDVYSQVHPPRQD